MIHMHEAAAGDRPAVEALLDRAFGPGRRRKTAERLREGRMPAPGLAFVARQAGELAGTLTFWPVLAGERPALLLGPLAVDPARRSRGLGAAMVRHGLARANALGHGAVILVGDPDYYSRFGFARELTLGLAMPGPVEQHRFLGLELAPGALAGAAGLVSAWPAAPAVPAPAPLAA